MKTVLLSLAAAASFAVSANALTITEYSGNLAAFGVSIDEDTRTITIRETWGPETDEFVVLLFEGWDYNRDSWTVNKIVTNNTGEDWDAFSHELLNADLNGSIDTDGLSFAQLGVPEVPRTSDVFSDVEVDELADRDYLNFSGGQIVPTGSVVNFSFGITARRDDPIDNVVPFYLRQSEFLAAIPEPATWAMMIAGFGLVGFAARRRRDMASVAA